MDTVGSIALFLVGLALVVYFSEKLVKGVVGASLGFGVSAFLISVVFIGFDPENLALGAVASSERVAGIALGSILGAAMVAIALAFGITALIAPMSFEKAPVSILAVPIAAVALFALLGLDGLLSRSDGAVLLATFALSLVFLIRLGRRGVDIRAGGEVAESLEKEKLQGKWASVGLVAGSLVAIVVGSELIVRSSGAIIGGLGLTETVFGMTILALLVSIEELARELPAALKGRADITYGNVAGSILAFLLFNAGIIALVRPIPLGDEVLGFYLPACALAVLVVSAFMATRRVNRTMGAVLVALYATFFVWGYVF